MARRQRIDTSDSWHHVMNRGAGRRMIYRDDAERRLFLELVSELGSRFGVDVHAYCLMGNHFHLLLHSKERRLSEAMQWLSANYTRSVNCRRAVDGAIFRGRFHSVSADLPEHRRWLFRYINANPLDLGWDRPLAEYPWSGLGSSPSWLRWEEADRLCSTRSSMVEFIEAARAASSERPSVTLGLQPSSAEVDSATMVASLPGPLIHGESDRRTVAAVVWVDDLGRQPEEFVGLGLGDQRTARQRLARARHRVDTRPELASFARRVLEVLATSHAPLPSPTASQSVSDTDCDGDVDGRAA